MKLGRNVVRTFVDYYKLTGYISTKPSSALLAAQNKDINAISNGTGKLSASSNRRNIVSRQSKTNNEKFSMDR